MSALSHFKDQSIKKKLLIVFGVSLFFVAGIVAVGIYGMVRMQRDGKKVYDEISYETGQVMKLKEDLVDSRRILLMMLVEKDRKKLEFRVQEIGLLAWEIDDVLDGISAGRGYHADIMPDVDKIKALWGDFKQTRDSFVIPAAMQGRRDYALSLATGVQEQRFSSMMELAAIIIGHEKEEAQLLQANMDRLFRKSIAAYLATAFCGLIAGTALILYIANDTIHSYGVIEDAVERFASGNEDGEVVIRGTSKDELGRLAEGLNKMFRKLYEDRINEQQYVNVLDWQAKESEKTAAELAVANISLSDAQFELEDKNKSLEANIMELKDLNRRLADTRAQMIQSEKMASLGQLAAGVAHEINNPIAFVGSNLNALSGYMEDIKKFFSMCSAAERHIMGGNLNEATAEVGRIASFRESAGLDFAMKDSLQIISESSDGVRRISEIVRGLKDFSHVDGSDVMDYNINKCLEDSIKIAWHEIKYRAELNKEFGDIPSVVCRPRQLNQVFLNIITNAAQAMGAEKGLISVRTYAKDGVVVAEIEDNGSGMSDEVLRKIFDPFFTTKPVGKGTGLGLAIASGIIRDHGGSIDIESREGVGSKFTIMLPIRNERLEAASLTA